MPARGSVVNICRKDEWADNDTAELRSRSSPLNPRTSRPPPVHPASSGRCRGMHGQQVADRHLRRPHGQGPGGPLLRWILGRGRGGRLVP
jgi:hypothetical protein